MPQWGTSSVTTLQGRSSSPEVMVDQPPQFSFQVVWWSTPQFSFQPLVYTDAFPDSSIGSVIEMWQYNAKLVDNIKHELTVIFIIIYSKISVVLIAYVTTSVTSSKERINEFILGGQSKLLNRKLRANLRSQNWDREKPENRGRSTNRGRSPRKNKKNKKEWSKTKLGEPLPREFMKNQTWNRSFWYILEPKKWLPDLCLESLTLIF